MILFVSFLIIAMVCSTIKYFIFEFVPGNYDFWKVFIWFIIFFIACNILFLVVALIISFFINKSKYVEKPNHFCKWVSDEFAQMLCIYCNVRTHVTGVDKLPENNRFLMISNHRSNLDPMLVMNKLREYGIAFISKPENLNIPIVGDFIHQCCFLPIDRDNPRNAMKTIIIASDYLKNNIASIAVYPEGTRSKSINMLPFHAGSLKIAQKAGVPIVIASVRGTERVANRFPKPTDVYLDIIEVISADEVKACKTVELAEKARNVISNHLYLTYGEETSNQNIPF